MKIIERHVQHPDTPTDTHNPIDVNPETCISCVVCDYVCPGDIIYKPEIGSGELPVIAYPDECWYCGLCEQACPTDAITVVFPEQMLHCETPVRDLLGKRLDPDVDVQGGAD